MDWRAQPIHIYVHCRDGKGRIASPSIRLGIMLPYAQAEPFAVAWADAMAGASGAEILGFDIVSQVKGLGMDGAAATSDCTRQGVLLFGTTEAEDRYLLEIPSIKQDLLEATGEYAGVKIDITKPAIQNLISLMLDGAGGVSPIGLTGNDLTSLITAYQRRL